jgi:metal-responsive CopG/Arc/MetJ family transcriptional regulator
MENEKTYKTITFSLNTELIEVIQLITKKRKGKYSRSELARRALTEYFKRHFKEEYEEVMRKYKEDNKET